MFQPTPSITKEYILENLSQERIMQKYLDVPVQYDHLFKSPLRIDNNPTCCFSWKNEKLWFRDWAMHKPLDIFGVVMEKYICNFREAIDIIAEDFGLTDKETSRRLASSPTIKEKSRGSRNSEKSDIRVKLQRYTQDNISYLQSYGIHSDTVKKFNVFSPAVVWLNGEIFYVYDDDNPALAYYFGKDEKGHEKWKIYFYRKRGDFRFLGNTSRINGWIQIPEVDDLLIITKSLKDVMAMYEFGLNAIAMQGESTIPYDYITDELKQRFDNILTLYDHDEAGIRNAEKINELYGIPSAFITQESLGVTPGDAKDFSDYVKLNDRESVIELVEAIERKAKSHGNDRASAEEALEDLQRSLPQEP